MLTENPIRALARTLRHTPDRLMHRARRRRARAAVADWAARGPVLVVCHGNICRSPYAALRLGRDLASVPSPTVTVTSAGFISPGRPSPPHAVTAARSRGIDLSAHRSRVLSPHSIREAGLILVMDVYQQRAIRATLGDARRVIVLGDLDPDPISKRTIRDPIEQPLEVFIECYERIDRCVGRIVATLRRAARGR